MDAEEDDELVSALERVESNYIRDNYIGEYKNFLKNHFGFDDFREFQLKIISSVILEKRDNFVIMATGQGKSLLYQVPSLWTGGLTIVVSPLISLMRDQVYSLNQRNIPATFLGSAQTDSRKICDALVNSNFYRIVYVCPEFITHNKSLVKQLESKLTLIAIDEAHCVSHWGHDFRTDYQQLGELRKLVPNVPIIAVTATATQQVRKEIEASLHLNNPQFTCTGFDRPNLELLFEPLNQFPSTIRKLARTVNGSIIVYCPSRGNCEKIAESLKKDSITCEFYHAGIDKEKRADIEIQFKTDQLRLIISTCAFGMGIDKPDVRYVIHYRGVKSIEQYYQEIGRAGRDGNPSKAIIFFERTDVAKYLSMMQNQNVLGNASPYARRNRMLLGSYFEQYLISERCRRLNILQYFEGLSVSCLPRANCCDNCTSGKSSKYLFNYRNMDEKGFFDFTQDSRILLNIINSIPNGILRSNINPQQQKKLNHHHDSYWDGLIDVLERLMYVKTAYAQMLLLPQQKKSQPEVIMLDKLGLEWLCSNEPLKFQLQPFDKLTRYMEVKTLKLPEQPFSTAVPTTTNPQNMVQLIKENPYPRQAEVHDITYRHREVMDLINKKLSIPEIEEKLSLSRSTVTGFVSTLLQHGYPIMKKDLERLYGVFGIVFQSIFLKMPENIFNNKVVRTVKSQLPGVSCDQIRLVQCYRYPRVFLKHMGLKFNDPDEIPYAATQFVPSTLPTVEYGIHSFIKMFFSGLHSYEEEYFDGDEYEDPANDDENMEDSEIEEEGIKNEPLSQEITQENIADDTVLGWDDFSRKRTHEYESATIPKRRYYSESQ